MLTIHSKSNQESTVKEIETWINGTETEDPEIDIHKYRQMTFLEYFIYFEKRRGEGERERERRRGWGQGAGGEGEAGSRPEPKADA